jgi:hypothetical protein
MRIMPRDPTVQRQSTPRRLDRLWLFVVEPILSMRRTTHVGSFPHDLGNDGDCSEDCSPMVWTANCRSKFAAGVRLNARHISPPSE